MTKSTSKRRYFSPEFKRDAVAQVEQGDLPAQTNKLLLYLETEDQNTSQLQSSFEPGFFSFCFGRGEE